MESADLSKRVTRKWPGLGPNVFVVDYAALFPEFGEYKAEGDDDRAVTPAQAPPAKGGKGQELKEEKDESKDNEIISEIEVKNTHHHKAIIKARNEYYTAYKKRFEKSIRQTMDKYDDLRKEENRFSEYWTANLHEITKKHI